MFDQCWANVVDGGTILADCVVFAGMAVRANTGQSLNSVLILGQRRIQLIGIEPAMGYEADPFKIEPVLGG